MSHEHTYDRHGDWKQDCKCATGVGFRDSNKEPFQCAGCGKPFIEMTGHDKAANLSYNILRTHFGYAKPEDAKKLSISLLHYIAATVGTGAVEPFLKCIASEYKDSA